MTNRRAMKLFAVTILAGASSASASPATQAVQGTPKAPAQAAEKIDWGSYVDASIKPRLIGTRPAPGNVASGKTKGGGWKMEDEDIEQPRLITQRSLEADLAAFDAAQRKNVFATIGMAKPKRVPGLTDAQRAALEPIDMAQEKINLVVKATPEAVVIRPRVLANARPACGNTGGKSDTPDDCSMADISLASELNKWEAKQAEKRWAKYERDQKLLFAAATAVLTAEPSLKARLYINGSPACGNTQGKAGPASYCRIGNEQ